MRLSRRSFVLVIVIGVLCNAVAYGEEATAQSLSPQPRRDRQKFADKTRTGARRRQARGSPPLAWIARGYSPRPGLWPVSDRRDLGLRCRRPRVARHAWRGLVSPAKSVLGGRRAR